MEEIKHINTNINSLNAKEIFLKEVKKFWPGAAGSF